MTQHMEISAQPFFVVICLTVFGACKNVSKCFHSPTDHVRTYRATVSLAFFTLFTERVEEFYPHMR